VLVAPGCRFSNRQLQELALSRLVWAWSLPVTRVLAALRKRTRHRGKPRCGTRAGILELDRDLELTGMELELAEVMANVICRWPPPVLSPAGGGYLPRRADDATLAGSGASRSPAGRPAPPSS